MFRDRKRHRVSVPSDNGCRREPVETKAEGASTEDVEALVLELQCSEIDDDGSSTCTIEDDALYEVDRDGFDQATRFKELMATPEGRKQPMTCNFCNATVCASEWPAHCSGNPHRSKVAQAHARHLKCDICNFHPGHFKSLSEFSRHFKTERHVKGGKTPNSRRPRFLCGLCGQGPDRDQWHRTTAFRKRHIKGRRHRGNADNPPAWWKEGMEAELP